MVTYVSADMWGMQEYAGEICLGEDIYEERSVWERTYMRITAGEASLLVWKAYSRIGVSI